MSRDRFDESFERLRDASNRHAEVQKSTDRFDEIAASRIELEKRRQENTADRREIVSRRDYATPDRVPPGLGVEAGMSRRTLVMASLGALVFLASVGAVAWVAVRTVARPVFVDGEVVETLVTEPECRWNLAIPVSNTTEGTVLLQGATVIVNRESHGVLAEATWLGAGERTTLSASIDTGACDASTDDIDHASIWIEWRPERGPTEVVKHRF